MAIDFKKTYTDVTSKRNEETLARNKEANYFAEKIDFAMKKNALSLFEEYFGSDMISSLEKEGIEMGTIEGGININADIPFMAGIYSSRISYEDKKIYLIFGYYSYCYFCRRISQTDYKITQVKCTQEDFSFNIYDMLLK